MLKGEVVFFNERKNFGTIMADGNIYFFHKKDVKSGIINDGDKVGFRQRQGNINNLSAYDISKLNIS